MTGDNIIILALFPNTRGFGYVLIQSPNDIIEFGVANIRPRHKDKFIGRVHKLLAFFNPSLVILNDKNGATHQSALKTQELIMAINSYCTGLGIITRRYSRRQIKEVFEQFKASTKQEIAHMIAIQFPELVYRTPKERKPWMEEDYNMGIFDAMSLIITHTYLNT